jgi:hypothetical protein
MVIAVIWRFFSYRIVRKITLPYGIVICAVAIAVAILATDVVQGALEQKFREELATAGRSANEAMVLTESANLATLRQMLYTEGLTRGLETGDRDLLGALLAPILVNSRLPYLDVLGPDGILILALRPTDSANDPNQGADSTIGQWLPVQRR